MGRERQSLVREGGFLDPEKLYIIAYEGEITEKKYFVALRQSPYFNDSGQLEIIPLPRLPNTGTDPISVKRRLKIIKSEVNIKPTDECWLVIDRDDWETIHKISFEQLVEDCKKEKNFFIALSNPCFELWLLLHYKKLSELSDEERDLIFENQKISNSKNYISTLFDGVLGRGLNKRSKMSDFLPHIYTAIENAKAIASPEEAYPKSLGTDVYKLVEKIINQIFLLMKALNTKSLTSASRIEL